MAGHAGKDCAKLMKPDLEKYRPYFEEFDLTDDQKTAMIEALWSIAEAVADLAYGVHSSQLMQAAKDNDSCSDSNVIEFFQLAATDPVLDEFADALQRLEAHNDNIPQSEQKKEAGT